MRRNQTRDHLEVVAFADRYGLARSAGVLARIDEEVVGPRTVVGARGRIAGGLVFPAFALLAAVSGAVGVGVVPRARR